jgi:uncharacterized membrane protein YhiD involved in acid resistance
MRIGMTGSHIFFGAIFAILLIVAAMWVWPQYMVWQQGKRGEAELARAEANRKVLIKEAEAAKEAAKYLAEADLERAKGEAKAIQEIGSSLTDARLTYLWIQMLEKTKGQIIYVPTEAGLPILEAGRFKREPKPAPQK